MKIQQIPVGDVRPYEKNPRLNDGAVEAVAASIEKYGFLVPLVVSEDKEIVTGHTRYKAALKMKLKTVPCVIASELTEQQIKAFRLVDNKVGEIAEWDVELLSAELSDIAEDLSVFAFDLPVDGEADDEAKGDSGKDTSFNYQEQYGVIVMCDDEAHQETVYEKLAGMGYNCKVVAT